MFFSSIFTCNGKFLLILSPSCFVVCGDHLSPGIAIVFSLPSYTCTKLLRATFVCYSCIFHVLPLREFYSIAFPQGHIFASSSSYRLLVYLFGMPVSSVVEVPYYTKNRSFSVFAYVVHWAVQVRFHSYPLSFSPTYIFKHSSSLSMFPRDTLSLVSILSLQSCTPQTSVWTTDLLGFLLCPSILSRLRYPTFFQLALLLLSPIQPYQLWLATSFLACSLLYIAISTFCVSICLKWVHSQFCS